MCGMTLGWDLRSGYIISCWDVRNVITCSGFAEYTTHNSQLGFVDRRLWIWTMMSVRMLGGCMALLVRLHCSVRVDIAVERSGSIMQTPFGYHLVICHKIGLEVMQYRIGARIWMAVNSLAWIFRWPHPWPYRHTYNNVFWITYNKCFLNNNNMPSY